MSDSMRVPISTRCPTCGSQSLFVGSGGHLTCALLTCRNPSVSDAIERYKAIEMTLARFVDNSDNWASLAGIAAKALHYPDYFDRAGIAEELQMLDQRGRSLLGRPKPRPAVDAVDPNAASTGTPTTRE
jgi:hypothetical protein